MLNAPGCKHNCVQLYNSVHKLLTKSRNLDTIADEVLPLIGDQALKFIRESEKLDLSSTEVEDEEVDVNQEDVQPMLAQHSRDVQQDVQQEDQQVEENVEGEENSTPKRRGRVQGGGRKGKKVLKQQLDKFMLAGKRKRRVKFVL